MARTWVRGLAASSSASAQRLKAMAQERAETMATRIQRSVRHAGIPPAASTTEVSAKGSAKMECSHLIISNVMRVFLSKPIARTSTRKCIARRVVGFGPGSRRLVAEFRVFEASGERKNRINPGNFEQIHDA